jgi:ribosome-associated protein
VAIEEHNESKELAIKFAKIAQEYKSRDVQVVDLRGKSPATYFFVIATCKSGRQARTVADQINNCSKEMDQVRFGQAGYEAGKWVLLDFVDVVVHIFDEEYREFYQLEKLWGDAPFLKF